MMAEISISLQKRGFCVETPYNDKDVDWDKLTDALFGLPNVCEVDGPQINGCVGVTYDDDNRPDAVLIAELRKVFDRFV